MKAIVTGGGGFIGSNLALRLESEGAKVTVVDDFSSARFENLRSFRGPVVAEDIFELDWDRLGSCDVIFHEAALTDTTITDQKKMMRVNVEGFRRLIHFAAKQKCKLIYASSAAVYGNEPAPQSEEGRIHPLNVYGYSKQVGDEIAMAAARESRIHVVGLRYFNVFGMGEQGKGSSASMIYQLAQQMRAGKRPRIFADGEQARDHIYVKDVVEANLAALNAKQSCVVNVGTGIATTFNRLIELLNETLSLNLKPDYFENPYLFYQNETRADTAKGEKLIGFRARHSVREGIQDYFKSLYGITSRGQARENVLSKNAAISQNIP